MADWAQRLCAQMYDGARELEAEATEPRIELLGDRRVIVENHRGILEYGAERMRIACGRLTLCVAGEGLELCALSMNELAVTGRIRAVTYE